MSLRELLIEYGATDGDLSQARTALKSLSGLGGGPGSVCLIAILEKEIATCEAYQNCIKMMLEIVPAEILDKEPSAEQMLPLTCILMATQLLRSNVGKSKK